MKQTYSKHLFCKKVFRAFQWAPTHIKKLYIFPNRILAFILTVILFLTFSPTAEIYAKNIHVLQTASTLGNTTKKAC